jgi:hypothetical protein
MFYRLCLALALGLASAWAQQAPPNTKVAEQPNVPNTPAGRTFTAWLEAFNSGDRTLVDVYCRKYEPSKSVDDEMQFRGMTGGFDLLEIVKSEKLRFEVLLKERHSETKAVGKLDVKDGEPGEVMSFGLQAIPPGTSVSDLAFTIDAATRARVIEGAIAKLDEFYVFPEISKKMGDAVRERQKRGEYDSVTDGDAFAEVLTDNFQEVSHDKHLRVDFSPAAVPERPEGPPGC